MASLPTPAGVYVASSKGKLFFFAKMLDTNVISEPLSNMTQALIEEFFMEIS